MAAAAILPLSCATEFDDTLTERQAGTITRTVTIEGNDWLAGETKGVYTPGEGVKLTGDEPVAIYYADPAKKETAGGTDKYMFQATGVTKTAEGRYTFTQEDKGIDAYDYYFMIPDIAAYGLNEQGTLNSLQTASVQHPKANSFDPDYEILVGKARLGISMTDELAVTEFKRITTPFVLRITDGEGILGGEMIYAVTAEFSQTPVSDNCLAGLLHVRHSDVYAECGVASVGSPSNAVSALYAEGLPELDNSWPVWYMVNPAVIAAGETLTVTVTTPTKIIERTVTLTKDVSIKANTLNRLTINISGEGHSVISRDGVLDFLNLDYPGLEAVKAAYNVNDMEDAYYELKEYFRHRTNVTNTDVDLAGVSVSASAGNIASQALEYRFYVKNFSELADANGTGLDRFYSFKASDGGIDWKAHITDVPDEEFKMQRHRFQWMEPQAKVYYKERNEEHAGNWIDVYSDWMEKHPFPDRPITSKDEEYFWHGLQTAERTKLLTDLILYYYIESDTFTPEIFCNFLRSISEHVEMIRYNWYYKEDHNIYVSQLTAMMKAAILLPEFKNAGLWISDGSTRLVRSLGNQFHPDGVQVEFDPSYHMGVISNFASCITLAEANGTEGISSDLLSKMDHAAEFIMDITYPDYTIDNFNDTRSSTYNGRILKRNLGNYSDMFPGNAMLKWVATEGAQGTMPAYLAKEYPDGGYYIFRSAWGDPDATMMVMKNHHNYPGTFHCQPDNGTFGLYHQGRILFPDAGVFKYEGDAATNAMREKYRATANHNTVTFDGKTIDDSHKLGQRLKFTKGEEYDLAVISNNHQDDATHRRAVFFVGKKFFVIVDEAYGTYEGPVDINFHMLSESGHPTVFDASNIQDGGYCDLYSTFDSGNMLLRSFSESTVSGAERRDSKISDKIDVESGDRVGFSMTAGKTSSSTARFITVIWPFDGSSRPAVGIQARFDDGNFDPAGASVLVTVDGTEYNLSYTL